MKKLSVYFFLLLLIILVAVISLHRTDNSKTIGYRLNGKTYRLLTANTSAEWEKGLMFYRKLEGADGMIFIFPDKNERSFWNQNTFMDLDLYWLNDDTVIGKSFLPSIEKSKNTVIVSSSGKVNKVIELEAGK